MCLNKSKGLSGAKPQTEFPLTLFSLQSCVFDFLVKFILPLLMTHGLLLLGMPGVGKTPFVTRWPSPTAATTSESKG